MPTPTGFSTLGKGRGRLGSKVRMFLDPRNLATMNAKMRNAINIALDTATPLLRKKAQDIKIIYVDKITTLTDIFMICTSNSDAQSRAITNNIKEGLEKYSVNPAHIEGYQNLKWVLMDYINVTVNIFQKDYREYYNIERLWADAKIVAVKDSM